VLPEVDALAADDRARLFSDLGHLTVAGDRAVGQLIAKGVADMNHTGRVVTRDR
jgi:hypothetical protein